ncbi:MAG: zinc ribbon domain-containing protein [Candidatus Hydrothermarchaeales archaeon]
MDVRIVNCRSCGMPMEEASQHACGEVESLYCTYCTTPNGVLKSREQIREQLVRFHMESLGMTREEAEAKTDSHMKSLPEWQQD